MSASTWKARKLSTKLSLGEMSPSLLPLTPLSPQQARDAIRCLQDARKQLAVFENERNSIIRSTIDLDSYMHAVTHFKQQTDALLLSLRAKLSPQAKPEISIAYRLISHDVKTIKDSARDVAAKADNGIQPPPPSSQQFSQHLKLPRKSTEVVPEHECQCCFKMSPSSHIVRCNSNAAHAFCRDCMRTYTERLVGGGGHHIKCISIDGCCGEFWAEDRGKFVDALLQKGLDRIQTQDVLREANLENFFQCPFCPFGAECESIEQQPEFQCPECDKASCRSCATEAHGPISCAEAAEKHMTSDRQKVEDAMSAALIRKCGKCRIPFIKGEACNRIVCNQKDCGYSQCYVCREPVLGYDHFYGLGETLEEIRSTRCPLYDNTDQRHEEEVKVAKENSLKLIATTRNTNFKE